MKKNKAGRPPGSKSGKTKQMNVRVALNKIDELNQAGKLEFQSFSQYVNQLISNDLTRIA